MLKLARRNAAPVTQNTDDTGTFRFEAVEPGDYELIATHEGFKAATVKVRVASRSNPPLAIRLRLADVQSAVTVNSQASQVSTSAADNLDTVTLSRQTRDDVPIFDQNFVGAMLRFLDAGSGRRTISSNLRARISDSIAAME